MATFTGGSNNTCKIFLNGNIEDSGDVLTITDAGLCNTSHYIGCSRNGDTKYMDGAISNYRIYNKALTAEEIGIIYNTEKGQFI